MGSMLLNFGYLLFFILNIHFGSACNGYQLKVNYVRNCGTTKGPNVIVFRNINATFSKDCYIIPIGCTVIKKAFTTGKVHYKIHKPPMALVEGDDDICGETKSTAMNLIKSLGIPENCPMQTSKLCFHGDKRVSMNSFKFNLPLMRGTSNLRVNIEHDVGSTCLDVNVTIGRKRMF